MYKVFSGGYMGEGIETAEVRSLGTSMYMSGYADDGYYRHIVDDKAAELDLLAMTSLLVQPGYSVLDIGANIGFYSLSAYKLMQGKGKVYSYEPSPSNYDLLIRNIEANEGASRVISAYNYGLSDEAASHELHFNRGNRGGAFISDTIGSNFAFNETIKTKVLDKLQGAPKKCDFIKIDIEGHEPNFLWGSQKFIKKHKPACIMEANHWCLNAFNDTSMPVFLEQVMGLFPVVYAFNDAEIVNVRDQKMHFMYQNIVHNRLQNLYCDFSEERAKEVVVRYERFLAGIGQIHALQEENSRLRHERDALESLLRSRSHRAAAKLSKILRRP